MRWPLHRGSRPLAVLAAIVLWYGGAPARADETPLGTFRYTVSHPTFGTIGTYTNTNRQVQINTIAPALSPASAR